MRARGRLLELLDEHDALGLELLDDEPVVDDLVPDIHRWSVELERPLHNVDRPHDAGAEAARRAEDNAEAGFGERMRGLEHAKSALEGRERGVKGAVRFGEGGSALRGTIQSPSCPLLSRNAFSQKHGRQNMPLR